NMNTGEILHQLLKDIGKRYNYEEPNIDFKAICNNGANYTSVLYEATISAPDKEDLKLFAKVAALSENARSQLPISLYDTERFVYTELFKNYAKIQNNNKLTEKDKLLWPEFYGCNANLYKETIVLENLAAKGYTTYDRFKSIDWPYAAKAVESLAKFHALSIAYGEENSEEYAKILENMKQNPAAMEHMKKSLETSVASALAVTKEEYKERLEKYIEGNFDIEKIVKYFQPVERAVLTHGDYRPSNLMHKINNDGSMEVIPVDYQTILVGNPVLDLLYFIFTGSDEEFRCQYYEQLIEHYYIHLNSALHNLNLDPDKLYSKENFKYDLKEFLPFGLICSIFTLPIITINTEDAPKPQGEDGLETIAINAVTKTSALYRERFNGIVNDYVRWGVI
ncbi:uncharacterized protein LOC131846343, partial [Achroia grisella]|uniref:uncharacterized protein LOC131846343 n=1 Tax=Achroia grisella TaxID=688607 RepID=UPI0027D2B5C4